MRAIDWSEGVSQALLLDTERGGQAAGTQDAKPRKLYGHDDAPEGYKAVTEVFMTKLTPQGDANLCPSTFRRRPLPVPMRRSDISPAGFISTSSHSPLHARLTG